MALEVSRSCYYWYKSKEGPDEFSQEVEREVLSAFRRHKRRYGTRRLVEELSDKDLKVGRARVRSIMQRNGLIAIQPKSFVPRTTKSHPHLRRSPNLLLDRDLPEGVNEIWVGDITYLAQANGDWLYLSVWLDLCSRHLVGWQVEEHMEEDLVIASLKKGLLKRQPDKGLIIHSDGGGQYASNNFRKLLDDLEFKQSMTRKENTYDNAHIESLFSRFKAEIKDEGKFRDLADAWTKCFEYIECYYNTIRKHSSLGYKSPLQFERELDKQKEKK